MPWPNSKKATRVDEISSKVFKMLKSENIRNFTSLYNVTFAIGKNTKGIAEIKIRNCTKENDSQYRLHV